MEPRKAATTVQLHAFTNGGACAHKLLNGRTSAWWDKDGTLLDCVSRDTRGRERKPSAEARYALAAMGPRMVKAAHLAAKLCTCGAGLAPACCATCWPQ